MLYAECGDRLTDAGADRAKARALAAQPNLARVGKAVDVALHRHFSTISRPASVKPSGQEAMSSSAKKSLVKIGEPSHTRRSASPNGSQSGYSARVV
jgi:hypothetical protein